MAKALLLDALTSAIGDFVEGISKENLKLGIWSGKVRHRILMCPTHVRDLEVPTISPHCLSNMATSFPWAAAGGPEQRGPEREEDPGEGPPGERLRRVHQHLRALHPVVRLGHASRQGEQPLRLRVARAKTGY